MEAGLLHWEPSAAPVISRMQTFPNARMITAAHKVTPSTQARARSIRESAWWHGGNARDSSVTFAEASLNLIRPTWPISSTTWIILNSDLGRLTREKASPLSSPCPPRARTPSTRAAARSPGALPPLARLANAARERNGCGSVHLEIFDQSQMCLNIHMQSLVCGKLAFKREAVRQPRELRFALLDFEKFNKLN